MLDFMLDIIYRKKCIYIFKQLRNIICQVIIRRNIKQKIWGLGRIAICIILSKGLSDEEILKGNLKNVMG